MSKLKPATQEAPIEPRSFYAPHAHFCVQMKAPKPVIVDGTRTLVDEKILHFTPIGIEGWGRYITDDPEVIAYLEAHPKVCGPEDYTRATTPPETLLTMAEDENTRLITQNNALIQRVAELEKQQAK